MYARLRALELWERYDLALPVDLRLVADRLSIEVTTFPFRGRVQEMIVDGVIGVRPGLSRPWFRWYVAHAIGHHVLHVGTSFHLEDWQWASRAKAERQAEEFASALLSGPDPGGRSARELGIPDEKMRPEADQPSRRRLLT